MNFISDKTFDAFDNITRWSKWPVIKEESLATNTFWVITATHYIISNLRLSASSTVLFHIMIAAIYHKLDKLFIGDVTYELKHNDFNGEEFNKIITEYTDFQIDIKFKQSKEPYLKVLSGAYKDSQGMFASIIKTAAALARLRYISKEIRLGNSNFIEIQTHTKLLLKTYIDEMIDDITNQNVEFDESFLTELYDYCN